MSEDLLEVEKLANGFLSRVMAGERRKVLRSIARAVQKSQKERIGRQMDPDGRPFTPRREKTPPKPGNHALHFLYPKGAAEPRVVFMKSWVRQGPIVTGYDSEVGAIRSFFWDKIAKFLPVPEGQDNASGGKLRRRGSIRKRAMFRKLSAARYLKAGADTGEAWVGFDGRAAEIARIHQEGRPDRPAPKAKPVPTPRRVLLGLSSADRNLILNMLLEHVAGS